MGYTLHEVLYRGHETRVVVGIDTTSGREVVLKLPLETRPRPRVLDQLRHEHAILGELVVPGVIRALALEPHEQGLALVLERWGQMSLEQLLARGRLPLGAALGLGAALARALGQVHGRGVIHRDVKPQNVLVDGAHGDVRLIDFGVAARRSAAIDAGSAAGSLAGTLLYMAPEQTGRMGRTIDARADLYALGVTLYEMLTGALPFEMTDALELIHAHVARTPTPPHERPRNSGALPVPEAVSAIVMKLLEKSPEQRYQTAFGVAFDLDQAARALDATGAVAPFALGARDWEDRVRSPSRLFGRERELSVLEAALSRAASGAVELALVAGPAGVGKSALVHALRDAVRARHGVFAPGKFDQLRRSSAFDAVARALGAIVRRRLSDPAEVLARWTSAWQEAAGPNAQILIDLVPELRHLLDAPARLPDIGPVEARVRLQKTVQRFVRTSATAEHPLVLFIDDLQWADAPSLGLLQEIAADPEASHLLILAAYRDNEVEAAHPLHGLAAAARGRGRGAETIGLAPLRDDALRAMIGDMLSRPADAPLALAAVVKAKTDGSPFFVAQFLRVLHERRLLELDLETGRFHWDEERIERAGVTDNVATLLAAKLAALPAAARRALSVAACVGPSFEAALVGRAAGLDAGELRGALGELLDSGMVVAADEESNEGEADEEATDTYAFVHDRVQQAAYEALDEGGRALAHLALARELERGGDLAERDDELFALLDHRLRSLALIEDADEARRVATTILRGGRRARAASAYAEAATFLRAGHALLSERKAIDDERLAFDMMLLLAEAEWLAGRIEVGEQLFLECGARARDRTQRARVATVWPPLLKLANRQPQALELSLASLAELGFPFPRDPGRQKAAAMELIERVGAKISDTSAAAFRAMRRCSDPDQLLAGELMDQALFVSTSTEPSLFLLMALSLLEHTFDHGISSGAAYATGGVMIALVGPLQQVELGARCGELLRALLQVPGMPRGSATLCDLLASHFVLPLDQVLEIAREAAIVFEREGNVHSQEFADSVPPLSWLLRAVPLWRFRFVERTWRNPFAERLMSLARQSCEALRDATARGGLAAIQGLLLPAPTVVTDRAFSHATSAFVALHLGEDAEALRLALIAEPLWTAAYSGPADVFIVHTFTLLTATYPDAEGVGAEPVRRAIALHRGRLDRYAAVCPTTFRHMRLLVQAGDARAGGRHEEAERLYEQAIADAHDNGFTQSEALGLRLAGEHALGHGRVRLARTYLRDAHDTYGLWGAGGAAARLRARYPDAFPSVEEDAPAGSEPVRAGVGNVAARTSATSDASLNARLDVASALRAAQALTGDMDLGALLGRMLRVLAENAGAERAVLVLTHGGELRIRAELSVEPEALAADLDEPLVTSLRVPVSLVRYVAQSREPVVLGQASGDGRFEDDPYLRERRPASVLAVPLLHQGRLDGVAYLEHPRAEGAFPEARVDLITPLAAQAATAVENATLYARLQAANARLERVVDERTMELVAAMERVERELADRIRAEADRAMLQEQVFAVQRERLLELSTPLIPITDHIVVMPLIGAMDAERSHRMMETALAGAAARRASFVILDITGVRSIDEGVAGMLVRTGGGLRLLGAHAVITGVSPAVASTLVDLDTSLGALVTRGTLQSGIAYAMRASSRRRGGHGRGYVPR